MAAGPESGGDPVQVKGQQAAVGDHRDLDDLPSQRGRDGEERHIGRRGQHYRRTGPGEHADRRLQALDHVGQRLDPDWVHGPALPGQPGRHRRRQLGGRGRGQVAVGMAAHRGPQRVLDGRGGAEVHLGHEGAQHLRARGGPLQAGAAAQFGQADLIQGGGQPAHRTAAASARRMVPALAGRPRSSSIGPVHRAVHRLAGLLPPALGQRAVVHRAVADRVQELGHRAGGLRVVTRDGQVGAARVTGRPGQVLQVPVEDVVEHLDHRGAGQMALEQLAAGDLPRIQVGDVPVPRGIVVAGVEHGLVHHRPDRDVAKGGQRSGHHHQVAVFGRFAHVAGPGHGAELGDQILEGVRAAGVAQDHRVPGGHAEPGHRAADLPAADKSHRRHVCDDLTGAAGRPGPGGSAGCGCAHRPRWCGRRPPPGAG